MSQQQGKVPAVSLEELLTHAGWARRLARGLLSNDVAAAEDTVQDAFLAAVQNPPASGGALRGWLRKVLTNERLSRLLSDRRREARELAVTAVAIAEPPPSPEQLAATVEVQRLLAAFVLALPEPFRQTLVLRYYDDRSSAEIARLLEVPAGTVRWRLKEGLSRLRARLDQERGGAEAWRAALAPIAVASRSSESVGRVAPARARVGGPAGIVVGVGVAALSGVGVALVLGALSPRPAIHPGGEAASTPAAPPVVDRRVAQVPTDEEVETMKTEQLKRVAAFVGVGLPALVASAGQSADPPVEEAIAMCMTAQEKSFECKEEVVAAWMALRNPPEKHREVLRKKMLEEIVDWGSGPLPPRREKCEQLVLGAASSRGTASKAASWKKDVMATMRECFARPDCSARATCIAQLTVAEALPEAGPSGKEKAMP